MSAQTPAAPPLGSSSSPTNTRLLKEFCTSGLSVASATILTNPIDVIKTRIQLGKAVVAAAGAEPAASGGLVATGSSIARHEGLSALWKGVTPAVARALLYGGLRLGMYTPTKEAFTALAAQQRPPQAAPAHPPSQEQHPQPWQPAAASSHPKAFSSKAHSSSSATPTSSSGSAALVSPPQQQQQQQAGGGGSRSQAVLVKVAAGVTSGGVAAAICNPTELIKVRLQADAGRAGASPWGVARQVVASDGLGGLWRGAGPGLVRAAVLTASQCATYDEVKGRLQAVAGWGDHLGTHLACAMATGLVSTTATNPVDVVKTHMFTGGGKYRGAWHCTRAVYAAAGLGGFWRGWAANYARIGPQTVVTLVVAEKLRQLAGLASF